MEKTTLINELYIAQSLFCHWQSSSEIAEKLKKEKANTQSAISNLNNEKNIEAGVLKELWSCPDPVEDTLDVVSHMTWVLYIVLPLLLWPIGHLIVWLFQMPWGAQANDSFMVSQKESVTNAFLNSLKWFGIVEGSIIGVCVIILLIAFIKSLVEKKQWNEIKASHMEKARAEAQKTSKALERKIPLFDSSISKLSTVSKEAETAYRHIVSIGFIYKDYREIEAISQFIQYLESGRCDSLEGPYGCYNLWESERRMNLIIVGIQNILSQLEEIKKNQRTLYETIVTVQKNVVDGFSKIKGSIDALSTTISCASLECSAAIMEAAALTATSDAYQIDRLRRDLILYLR